MRSWWRWFSRALPEPDRFLEDLRMSTTGGATKADLYNSYREVFGTTAGKRVLWHLTHEANVYGHITVGAKDSHEAYFNDGKRSLVLGIYKQMNMEPSTETIQNITKEKKRD